MPQNTSADGSPENSISKTDEANIFDLNLPEVGPGNELLPHAPPRPTAVINHIQMLLRSRRKLSVQERAAEKNHEPFRL